MVYTMASFIINPSGINLVLTLPPKGNMNVDADNNVDPSISGVAMIVLLLRPLLHSPL